MNIRDLQYFVAVAELKHFGKAAERCYVSQPALSMQVQKLEDFLGVTLFERTNKQVMLTAVGEQLLERARVILQEVDELKNTAQQSQDPFAGEFRLGGFPTLAPYYFPTVVPKLIKAFPKLTLLLVEEKTEILIEQLARGELDAAFLAMPVNQEHFESHYMFEDSFWLAVSAQHPLSRQSSISLNSIKDQNILLLSEGHCLRDQAVEVCNLAGIVERQDFRATSLETLRQMVAANVGITLMPNIAKQQNDGLTYIPLKSPGSSRKIGLFWRKTSARKLLIEAISIV